MSSGKMEAVRLPFFHFPFLTQFFRYITLLPGLALHCMLERIVLAY